MIAHVGSGFDSYVVLNNLPQWRSVVKIIKNVAGTISFKVFNGYVDENKKLPNTSLLYVGRFILEVVWKKGVSYNLQPSLLKQEMEHDEVFEGTWEVKKTSGCHIFWKDVLSTAFCYARYAKGIEKINNFGMKTVQHYHHWRFSLSVV